LFLRCQVRGGLWRAAQAVGGDGISAEGDGHGEKLRTEGRVTFVDGLLASAVLVGLVLNAGLGAWWADPAAGFVIVFYGLQEARAVFSEQR